jgi:cytoskeletal protein CcmA (bactofilin family)
MTDTTHSGAGGRSHLGAGSRINGDLQYPGTVELLGHFKGRVEASDIIVENSGEVEGELHAASIIIKGQFNGRLTGGTVRLTASARVDGVLVFERLSVESGAVLNGKCMPQKPPGTP